MSNATEKAELESRLTKIRTAIGATLDRGVASYSDDIGNLVALGLGELRKMERDTQSQIARLSRGAFMGKIGFKRP